MQKFHFTFGGGSPLARYFVVIEAADQEAARLQMFAWFTRHWAGCYDEASWGDQAALYGLTELHVPKSASVRLMTNDDELSVVQGETLYHSGRVPMHTRGS